MDKEKQKIYERDLDNWVNWTNENNEDYKKHNLKLIRAKDLKKQKYLTTGFFIFLGLIILAGVIYYLGTNDRFISELFCNSTCENVCDKTCPKCPTNPCTCNCECPEFPDDLDINLNINDTDG